MDKAKFDQMVTNLTNEYINDDRYGSSLEAVYTYNISEACARLILVYNKWNAVLDLFARRGAHFWEFYADTVMDLRVYPIKLEDFKDRYESIISENDIKVLYDKNGVFEKAKQLTRQGDNL